MNSDADQSDGRDTPTCHSEVNTLIKDTQNLLEAFVQWRRSLQVNFLHPQNPLPDDATVTMEQFNGAIIHLRQRRDHLKTAFPDQTYVEEAISIIRKTGKAMSDFWNKFQTRFSPSSSTISVPAPSVPAPSVPAAPFVPVPSVVSGVHGSASSTSLSSLPLPSPEMMMKLLLVLLEIYRQLQPGSKNSEATQNQTTSATDTRLHRNNNTQGRGRSSSSSSSTEATQNQIIGKRFLGFGSSSATSRLPTPQGHGSSSSSSSRQLRREQEPQEKKLKVASLSSHAKKRKASSPQPTATMPQQSNRPKKPRMLSASLLPPPTMTTVQNSVPHATSALAISDANPNPTRKGELGE
jgi:hypothetical protein